MLFREPTGFFLCRGEAEGRTPLNAFDAALLRAGVGNTNLIKMSSILPPGCRRTGAVELAPGSFVPLAYASITASTPGTVIAAAVAVAVPEDPLLNGVIMEYSTRGHKEDAEAMVRAMAEDALRYRDFRIKEILSVAVEHHVVTTGAAFAAVVLHDQEGRPA